MIHDVSVNEHPTMRAPDGWDSPRFQAVRVAGAWFRQSGVVSSRPPAGNAHRWVATGLGTWKYLIPTISVGAK